MSVKSPDLLKLKECPAGEQLRAWTNFVQEALTHRKYIYFKQEESLLEYKESSQAGYKRLNTTSILEIYLKCINQDANFEKVQTTLALLKERVRSRYYGCLLGYFRRILAIFLDHYKFENTALGKKFASLEQRLPPTTTDDASALKWYMTSRKIAPLATQKESLEAYWKTLSLIKLAKESSYVPNHVSKIYLEYLTSASKEYFLARMDLHYARVFAYNLSPEARKILKNDFEEAVKKSFREHPRFCVLSDIYRTSRSFVNNLNKIAQNLEENARLLSEYGSQPLISGLDKLFETDAGKTAELQRNPYFYTLLKEHIRANGNFYLTAHDVLKNDKPLFNEFLEVLEYLYKLDIAENALTSTEVRLVTEKMLALHVAGKKYPTILKLNKNKIDDTGLNYLREVMEKPGSKLMQVCLEDNPISDSAKKNVEKWKLNKEQSIIFEENEEKKPPSEVPAPFASGRASHTSVRLQGLGTMSVKEPKQTIQPAKNPQTDEKALKIHLQSVRLQGLGTMSVKEPQHTIQPAKNLQTDKKSLKSHLQQVQKELNVTDEMITKHLKELENYLAVLEPQKTDLIPQGLSRYQRFAMVYDLIRNNYNSEHLEIIKKATVPEFLRTQHEEWLKKI